METRHASYYSATALSSAYALGAALPSAWIRPTLACSHNPVLSQFELYSSGVCIGILRYDMRGSELWLLATESSHSADAHDLNVLLRHVLDDALRRHVSVLPFSTVARQFMCEHRAYWALVPAAARARFKIPTDYRAGPGAAGGRHQLRVSPSARK